MTERVVFRRGGHRNSWGAGWRYIEYRAVHRPAWWRRRPWLVLMDYSGVMFSSDLDVVSGRYRTEAEAVAHVKRVWAEIEADHARISEREAEEDGDE